MIFGSVKNSVFLSWKWKTKWVWEGIFFYLNDFLCQVPHDGLYGEWDVWLTRPRTVSAKNGFPADTMSVQTAWRLTQRFCQPPRKSFISECPDSWAEIKKFWKGKNGNLSMVAFCQAHDEAASGKYRPSSDSHFLNLAHKGQHKDSIFIH